MKNNKMSEKDKEDTIVAISTPPGIGGIGIVRMSGPLSIEIASKIFLHQGKIRRNPINSEVIKSTMGRLLNQVKAPCLMKFC